MAWAGNSTEGVQLINSGADSFSLNFTFSQLCARYYMAFTDMTQDQVEKNTCRDNFMTPEEAQLAGLIDHVIGGENDKYVPYSVVKKFKDAGLIDNLSTPLLGL